MKLVVSRMMMMLVVVLIGMKTSGMLGRGETFGDTRGDGLGEVSETRTRLGSSRRLEASSLAICSARIAALVETPAPMILRRKGNGERACFRSVGEES